MALDLSDMPRSSRLVVEWWRRRNYSTILQRIRWRCKNYRITNDADGDHMIFCEWILKRIHSYKNYLLVDNCKMNDLEEFLLSFSRNYIPREYFCKRLETWLEYLLIDNCESRWLGIFWLRFEMIFSIIGLLPPAIKFRGIIFL